MPFAGVCAECVSLCLVFSPVLKAEVFTILVVRRFNGRVWFFINLDDSVLNENNLILGNILQPYVSPIESIAEDDDEVQQLHKRDKVNIKRHRKISATPTKVKKSIGKKVHI